MPGPEIRGVHDPVDMLRVFDQVFTSRDGLGMTFRPTIVSRGVLLPVHFVLDANQCRALAAAVRYLGEDRFYISLTERADPPTVNDWIVPVGSLDVYTTDRDLPFAVFSNALYSATGKWGLWVSPDWFCIVGGPQEFIETLYSEIGTPVNQMVEDFARAYGADSTRLLLERLFPGNLPAVGRD